ncbi:hypothetical protein MKW92_007176 [Papaver armeniacum]|nr:hypothetical protein MKW92_007176 [Papaver armeniacum]
MAWRSAGSLSRSLLSTARSSSVRSSPALPRLRPSQLPTSPPRTRRFPSLIQGESSKQLKVLDFMTLGELGCTQSLLPPVAACHLSHIYHLTLELSAGFLREMGKMANTGHQMLQQRIKDATNFHKALYPFLLLIVFLLHMFCPVSVFVHEWRFLYRQNIANDTRGL